MGRGWGFRAGFGGKAGGELGKPKGYGSAVALEKVRLVIDRLFILTSILYYYRNYFAI